MIICDFYGQRHVILLGRKQHVSKVRDTPTYRASLNRTFFNAMLAHDVQLTFTEMVSEGPISAIPPNNATQTLTRELQAILIAAPYSSIIFGVANILCRGVSRMRARSVHIPVKISRLK
jgi:hypothetical protein